METQNLEWLIFNALHGDINGDIPEDLQVMIKAEQEFHALLALHNALVEAVAWHLECDSCPLKNTTEAEKRGFSTIWATRRAARAEVDRLLLEEK